MSGGQGGIDILSPHRTQPSPCRSAMAGAAAAQSLRAHRGGPMPQGASWRLLGCIFGVLFLGLPGDNRHLGCSRGVVGGLSGASWKQ
eukprot:2282189-Pyramimonas_sp.AAC.1